MTTPAGLPIWARAAAAATYGGGANKRNYGGIGAVNANTDVTAEQYMRLCADVASLGYTSHLMMMEIFNSAGTFYVDWALPAWAPPSTLYLGTTPPSPLYPTVTALTGTSCHVEFPESPPDEFGVTQAIYIRAAIPTLFGAAWQAIDAHTFNVLNIASGFACPIMVY